VVPNPILSGREKGERRETERETGRGRGVGICRLLLRVLRATIPKERERDREGREERGRQ